MELSVVSSILGDYSLDESLAYLKSIGFEQMELGVGGYPGKAHADALVLSRDENARKQLLETFKKHGMKGTEINGTLCRAVFCFISLFHFLGRRLGKGNDKNIPRMYAAFFRQIMHPLRNHGCFPAARSRKHQHWSLPMGNGLLLFLRKPCKIH